MLAFMRFPIVLGLAALFAAACGSNDPGTPNGPCGDNHACPTNYTCDLRTNICVLNGSNNPDGGGSTDARTPDGATGADAGNRDGGGTPDGGGGGTPDGGGTTSLVTTIDPVGFDASIPINDTTPTFDLSATIAGATFECKLDAGSFEACTSPFTTAELSEGAHTLTVRATAGNVHELNPPHIDFTIDVTAPTVSIDSPADNSTIGANSTLIYSANEVLQEFDCSLDGGQTFMPCGSGLMGSKPLELADGTYTAIVKGTDRAGNPSAPVTVHFTIDSAALTVSVDPRTTQCANESISFTASKQSNVTFSCSLDGAITDPCTSPFMLPSDIAPGMHTFIVTATDELQRTGVGMLSFTIDRTPLQVSFDTIFPAPDAFGLFDPHGTVTFTVNKTGVTAVCFMDGDNPAACDPTLFEGSFDYGPLDDAGNPHTFNVMATDACGGTAEDSHQFSVDSTPPAPCLVDAFTANGGDHLSNEGGGCLAFAETGATGSITFNAEAGSYTCEVDTDGCPGKVPGQSPFPIGQAFTCSPGTPIDFSGLDDCGENGKIFTLVVNGKDVHGNMSRVELPWTVDSTPPILTFGDPVTTDNQGNFTVTYTSNEPVKSATCSVDFGTFAPCSVGTVTITQLPAGLNTLAVNATDHWANTRVAQGPDVQPEITYTPNAGRLIVIGHDFERVDDSMNTTKILTAALGDVPWRMNDIPPFDRPVRVVAFNPKASTANEAANLGAIALATGVEVTSFDVATDLPHSLIGSDILLIPDQNNAATIGDVAAVFGNTDGVGGVIQRFLNDGGTVILLDGWENATTNPSDTFEALGAFISIDDAGDLFEGTPIPYVNGIGDTLLPPQDQSDLFFGVQYNAVNSTVAFFVSDTEEPRFDYGVFNPQCNVGKVGAIRPSGIAADSCTLPTVIEKIFPIYTIDIPPNNPTSFVGGIVGGPGDPVNIVLDPDDLTFDHFDCALQCNGQLCPCPGGQFACTCADGGATDVNGNPAFPKVTSQYLMEVYVVDTHGRPGRSFTTFMDDALPIDISDTNASATTGVVDHHLCFNAVPKYVVKEVYTLFFNGNEVTPEQVTNPSCPAGSKGSFLTSECGTFVVQARDTGTNPENFGSQTFDLEQACAQRVP